MKTLKEIRNSEAESRYGQSYNDCLEWVDRKELSQMDEQIAKDFAFEVAKKALSNAYEETKNTLQEFAFRREGVLSKYLSEVIESNKNIPKL